MSETTPTVWRERLTSALTWHYAGFGLLVVLAIGLAIRLGLDWAAIDRQASDVVAGKQVELRALEHETAPLRGLDKKVALTRGQLHTFFADRIPPNYSSIVSEFNGLAVKTGVRLSRAQFSQGAPGLDLTEISIDAGISGEYPQIMQFINGLERDRMFFVIRAMSLTGQQGGLVNLRLRISTWLRPADAAASGLPATPPEDQTGASDTAPADGNPPAARGSNTATGAPSPRPAQEVR
jgi:type IV pilus assembly protein PilO